MLPQRRLIAPHRRPKLDVLPLVGDNSRRADALLEQIGAEHTTSTDRGLNWAVGKALSLVRPYNKDTKTVVVPLPSRVLIRMFGQHYPKATELIQKMSLFFGVPVHQREHISGVRSSSAVLSWRAVSDAKAISQIASNSAWTKLRMLWASHHKATSEKPGPVADIPPTTSSTCMVLPLYPNAITNLREAGFVGEANRLAALGSTTTYIKARNEVPFGPLSSMKKEAKRVAFAGLRCFDMSKADLTVCADLFVPELKDILSGLSKGQKGFLIAALHGAQAQNYSNALACSDGWDFIERTQAVRCIKHTEALRAIRRVRRRMKATGFDLGIEVQRARARFINDVVSQHPNAYVHDQDAVWLDGDLDTDVVERCKAIHGLPTVTFVEKTI